MMSKLPLNQKGKEKSAFWLLNPASKFESLLLSLFFLLLPTQLGKHFWPDFSSVSGIRIDYLSPTVYVTDVILVLLFCFFLLRQKRNLKFKNQNSKLSGKARSRFARQFKIKKYFLLIFLLVLFLVLNTFYANHPLVSFYGIVKLLEYTVLVLYLAKTIRSQLQLQQISFLFAISALCESLIAIFQYLHQGSLNGIFYFFGERAFTGSTPGIANASIGGTLILRPYATFPHPNILAAYLLIAMVLVWSFVLKNKSRVIQLFAIISLMVSSVALLLTLSRVCIFLWIVLLLEVFGQLLFRQIPSLKIKISLVASIVIILVIIAALPLVHDVVLRFSQTSLTDESVTQRSALLSASWKMIQQRPLLGVGLDNFIPGLASLQKPSPLGLYLQPVHTIFVLAIAETGVIGFCLFLWLLWCTVMRIKNQESGIKNTFFILFAIVLVTGMFDHYWLTLQQGQLLFVTVLGLNWAKIQKS